MYISTGATKAATGNDIREDMTLDMTPETISFIGVGAGENIDTDWDHCIGEIPTESFGISSGILNIGGSYLSTVNLNPGKSAKSKINMTTSGIAITGDTFLYENTQIVNYGMFSNVSVSSVTNIATGETYASVSGTTVGVGSVLGKSLIKKLNSTQTLAPNINYFGTLNLSATTTPIIILHTTHTNGWNSGTTIANPILAFRTRNNDFSSVTVKISPKQHTLAFVYTGIALIQLY